MGLRPFFTYYGGKYRIAPKYPAPVHDIVIEPFCGSAGYSLRHAHKQVRLFDVNERVVRVWNYLIVVKSNEILGLPEEFDDVRNLSVCQEAKWLIGFWCNKGTAEPCHKPSAWMRSKIRPNSMWGSVIKHRIADQLEHIRHWTCELESYSDINNEQATWFIDPPYNNPSGKHYTHSAVNYAELADFCRSRLGQVIVCENEGATWLPFKPFLVAKSLEGSRGKKICREAIWIST